MVHIGACPECDKEVALTGAPSIADDAQILCPLCGHTFLQTNVTFRVVPSVIRPAASDDVSFESDEDPADEEAPEIFAAGDDGLPAAGSAALSEVDGEPGDVSPIDMPVVTPSAERQEYDAQISAEPRAVASSGSRSFFRQLVGIVGGGVVGLALGYFILLWIGGPQKDFLEIGDRLPRWAVPAAFHPAGAERREDRRDSDRSLGDLFFPDDGDDESIDSQFTAAEGLPPEPLPGDVQSSQEASPEEAAIEVAIIDPPQLDTANLEAAYNAAADVRLSLVAGELSDPALRPLKDSAYRAFSALAEAITFARPTPGREADHAAVALEAEHLLRDTLANDRMMGQLGRLAESWLAAENRGTTGVIVSGSVIGSHMGVEYQRGILVELAGTSSGVAVVGPGRIDAPRGAKVVVVGALVDEPRERIRGFTGSAKEVIWAGMLLP